MSMKPSESVAVLLNADSTTTTLRGDRLYLGINNVPQSAPLPFQVCHETDNDPVRHLGGSSGITFARIELNHYGDTATQVIDMAFAAKAELDNYNGTVTDDGDSLTVHNLHIEDETHQRVVQRAGREEGIANIRQSYFMAYSN